MLRQLRFVFSPVVFAAVIFTVASACAQAAPSPGGASNGYSYGRAITISHSRVPNTDQSNFPVLISGTYPYLATIANGGNVSNANGYDIVFTSDAGGNNPLPYERESYNGSNGAVNFWVQVPVVSHTTDTVIYMFYGNPSVTTDQQNASGTWNSNYGGVWHFPNGTALSASDSTANGNNGTINGATATNGEIDGGASFNGSTAYIDVPNSTSLNSTTATWSVWFKTTQSASNYPFILGRANALGSSNGISLFVDPSGYARVQVYGASNTVVDMTNHATVVNDGNWHYLIFTINPSTASLYVDGSSQGVTASPSGAWSFNSQDARFGISLDGFWGKWAGSEDEGRVSNVVRSGDWIQTEYNNQSSPSTFYSVGAAVTTGGTSNGYANMRPITISHTRVPNTDQSNCPVLISLPANTYADLKTTANGGSVTNANGYDILFTSDAGGTLPLAYARETYNGATGAMVDWVQVPVVSHTTDTVIYMFYGNPSVTTDQQNASGTWNSNYGGVWHFPNGTALSASDSTANGNNGTINGATATNGEIDGGASFNGSTAYIDVPNSTSLNSTTATWSVWFKTTQSASNYPFILGRANALGSSNGISLFVDPSGYARVQVYGASNTVVDMTNHATVVNDGNWHYLIFTINPSTASLYVDGSSQGVTASPSGAWSFNSQDARFGISLDGFWGKWAGSEDEGRVSNVVRSGDWIQTEYNNQSSPSTFYSVGAAVTGGGGPGNPIISSLSPASGSVGTMTTITGTGFGSTQGSNTVTFNGTVATPTSWGGTSITTAVPMGASTGNVVVTVSGMPSNGFGFATTIPVPTGLAATAGNAQVSLSWNASIGASSYNVYGSATNGGPYTEIASVTTLGYTNTGLTNRTPYYYVVTAVNSSGMSGNSNQASATPSWSNGYANMRPITISHTRVPNTDQSNCPVLISLPANTYADLKTTANGGSVTNANGYDILFTSDAGGTLPLAYARETYNGATGAMVDWVQVPVVSHTTDTVIYMFYGNPSVTTDQQNASGTWNSNYGGVWHFPNGTALSASDSTANGNNGTINGATATNGEIDGGASFNGSTAYIDVPNSTSLNSTTATWSVWFKTTQSASNYPFILGRANALGSSNGISLFVDPSGYARVQVYGASNTVVDMTNHATVVNDGNWHYLIFTINPSTASLYVDGSSQGVTASPSGAWSFNSQDARFGISLDGFWGKWAGSEDEGRVSNVVRSGDWIQTEYNNQSSPSTFYSVGAAVTGGGGPGNPIISSLSPASGSVGTMTTITGTGFGSTQGSNTVTFNGTVATPTSWSGTSITTAVPMGASTGNVVVTVSGVASNGSNFTVTVPAPGITSMSPGSGVVGTAVTISGANFGATQGGSTVTFGGVPATPTSWSTGSIVAPVPLGAVTGSIVVTVGGQTSNGANFTVVVSGPSITLVSPGSGAVGTPVTIAGANFGASQGGSTVTFGGVQATPTSWGTGSITAPVPPGAVTGNVVVTVGGQSSNGFSFIVGQTTINWNSVEQRIDGFGASIIDAGQNAPVNLTSAEADFFFSPTGSNLGFSLARVQIMPSVADCDSWTASEGDGTGLCIPSLNATTFQGELTVAQAAAARGVAVWASEYSPTAAFKSNGVFYQGGALLTNTSNYAAIGVNLASFVTLMANNGVPIYAVSIQNEPDINQNYPSCLWTPQQFHDVVPYVYSAFQAAGVGSTLLMIPEESGWDFSYAATAMNDPVVAADIGIIAGHAYYGAIVAPTNYGKSVWQSEVSSQSGSFDGSMTNALPWAEKIHNYLAIANVNAWVWWNFSEQVWAGDGTDDAALTDFNGNPAKRAYVTGQWSKFVRPGWYRIDVTDASGMSITAFKNATTGQFAVVVVNSGSSNTDTFTLNGFNATSVTPWITDATRSLVQESDVAVSGGAFSYTIPAGSVVTFAGQAQ